MSLPENYHRLASASPFDVESHLSDEVQRAESRATLIARQRVASRFRTYVSKAASEDEREARIDSIKQDVLDTVTAACAEHDFAQSTDEVQTVLSKVMDDLRIPFKVASKGVCADCGKEKELNAEGDCASCALDKEYDQHLERAAATKEAMPGDQNAGDTYTGERQDVETDTRPERNTSGEVDVDSRRNPTEHQEIDHVPTDADLDSDPTQDKVTETIDADTPLGPEEVGPKTDTFSDSGGQANPVTSAVSAKWRVSDAE
jgi:hypothetical protein